jgi:predicted GIY-YIG superfamily endonuclease
VNGLAFGGLMKQYSFYILANEGRMLYTGVTNDLMRRIYEHKNHLVEGYTRKYKISKLVYYDQTNDIYEDHHQGEANRGLASNEEN